MPTGIYTRTKPVWNKGLTKKDPRVAKYLKKAVKFKKGYKHTASWYLLMKGKIPWNKGLHPKYMQNENHPFWKGDKVGYHALHSWVRRKLGIYKFCEGCGSQRKKKYEWANISGTYSRDLQDWILLCTKCHRLFDNLGEPMLMIKKYGQK